jgi:hypothetical protein
MGFQNLLRPRGRRQAAEENMIRSRRAVERLTEALRAARYSYCGGGTHGFYNYPARFSPEIAREVIDLFSSPGDIVLDPFMGGGTSIIEGLCLGRFMIGVDVNALAHFVSDVRTAPLSTADEELIRTWAALVDDPVEGDKAPRATPLVVNLPRTVEEFMRGMLFTMSRLPFPRQRSFARCVLLRLGQWALDCRDFVAPGRTRLAAKLRELSSEMLDGLAEFVAGCGAAGLSKNSITGHRLLLNQDAVSMEALPALEAFRGRVRLVVTSPPYPGVHVLYHRWQYRGRKETAAPYWIAGIPDGHPGSFYTGGSRTPTGRSRYFDMIEAAFRSMRSLLDRDALVVQLVGFSNTATQLPSYLAAMDAAGFARRELPGADLTRRVPNRKWYAKLKGHVDASAELLLFHTPKR